MSELTTLARPYAKAAFDFAVEKGELAQWAEMLAFTAEIARDERVQHMLDASFSADTLAEMFITVGGDQLNAFGQNLIKVMAENKRLKALPEVCEQFLAMRLELEKEVEVQVISATALSEEQQQAISDKLAARLERKVKLNCSVDETLVAGVIIRAGDLVIDNSVSGRMRRLSDALQS
ncbi:MULTISPECIES: F0F1 ATP synthase subunit delta [Salinivibrio]|uniref:ATP synthase subunit delta n=2 Tax=Salinivibrio TaxID=51366 RepID=A0AA47LRD6_9GAMM|nr:MULTISPECIES: F0F1 ATP synthase subunit delta [Salinivibrio]OOE90687.1 F0F1 ATP synthase subunit delta [Salinivibrio sharmensis]WBA08640.1 F0F1 ATP synthase subunit delta [Salinivibrio kushneri]